MPRPLLLLRLLIALLATALTSCGGKQSPHLSGPTMGTTWSLRAMGADMIQGYFIAKPLAVDDFLGFMQCPDAKAKSAN